MDKQIQADIIAANEKGSVGRTLSRVEYWVRRADSGGVRPLFNELQCDPRLEKSSLIFGRYPQVGIVKWKFFCCLFYSIRLSRKYPSTIGVTYPISVLFFVYIFWYFLELMHTFCANVIHDDGEDVISMLWLMWKFVLSFQTRARTSVARSTRGRTAGWATESRGREASKEGSREKETGRNCGSKKQTIAWRKRGKENMHGLNGHGTNCQPQFEPCEGWYDENRCAVLYAVVRTCTNDACVYHQPKYVLSSGLQMLIRFLLGGDVDDDVVVCVVYMHISLRSFRLVEVGIDERMLKPKSIAHMTRTRTHTYMSEAHF